MDGTGVLMQDGQGHQHWIIHRSTSPQDLPDAVHWILEDHEAMSITRKDSERGPVLGARLLMIRIVLALPYRVAIALGRSMRGSSSDAALPLRRKIVTMQMRTALGMEDIRSLVIKVFMNQGEILVDTVRYAYHERRGDQGPDHRGRRGAPGRGPGLGQGARDDHGPHRQLGDPLAPPPPHGHTVLRHGRRAQGCHGSSPSSTVSARAPGPPSFPPKGKALMLIKELKKGRTIGSDHRPAGQAQGRPLLRLPSVCRRQRILPRPSSQSRARPWSCRFMP
ncbi:MAG: hypothetical protein MZU95_14215 [Desulfomicrobium escambiense]|nr:hypothetical protein [Desulfomicrobium escambiense]